MPRRLPAPPLLPRLALLAALLPTTAAALCTSDRQAQPRAVLERFVNADCESCWRDPATPRAPAGVLALDWIVPGARGEDAPLSMGESRDALDRLQVLGRPLPPRTDAVTSRRTGARLPLRVAQGQPVADYLGTRLSFTPPAGAPAGWDAWLVLVERLPAGAEGSPVARNLVRNVFRPDWPPRPPAAPPWSESRAMQIHEGTDVRRLRLVALVRDARGQMRAIAQAECPPGWPQ